uniref:epoxyqueuosine reductase QueH n=1 Tax=Eubacterium cellulosolvens TaxID=29322 RepID=UPI0012DF18C1|nr:epoxyqueuosine reductase QueH [[Eubacterium] cellulosolvens]
MNQKRNYQKEMEVKLAEITREGRVPKLMLHSCCAPCSSYVLEYLTEYFNIIDFYYNPNITDGEEYVKRGDELSRLIQEMPKTNSIRMISGAFEPEVFWKMTKGMEDLPEGGARCFACYALRLEKTAKAAKNFGCDFFTTTLSISPLKNAEKLNEIGEKLGEIYGVPYLVSDFKKKNGFKRSTELSEQYGLYRQNYCGCVFSKREAMEREKRKA